MEQRKTVDSLIILSKSTNDPTVFLDLCKLYRDNNIDSSILFGNKALELSISNKDGYNEGMSLAAIAASHRYIQDGFNQTIAYFKKAGEVFAKIGDQEKEARIYNNIGIEYDYTGDYSTALKYYIKALKLYEKIDFKQGQGEATNNIGLMYELMGDLDNAEAYYQSSADISFEIGDSLGWSMSIANLAAMHNQIGENDKAIELFNQAIEIRTMIGKEQSLTQVYNNLGALYYEIGDTLKAIELMEKTLALNIAKNTYKSIAVNYYNIGFIYHDLKEYSKAKEYYLNALEIAEKFHYYHQEKDYQSALSNLYADDNDFELAFSALLRYIEINDTLFNQEKERASLELREAYESEKKDITIAKQDAEIATELAINSRNRLMLFLSIGTLIIVVIFSIILFGRIRKIKQQKKEIERQKKEEYLQKIELQEKNKEITDSIQYAKRIQAAILPPLKLVKEYLTHSFILYKPKDIVAGDFYWMETSINSNSGESLILFAAADCTGHGVPGAMVSVVCHNAMNRAVREYKLTNPAQILDKTREIVIHEFEKSEEEVKDGMDIALCSLELLAPHNSSKESISKTEKQGTKKEKQKTAALLQYAGANNPLWIIRNGIIHETKADKQPIGKFDYSSSFTNHTLELQKGDVVYIFSDGYVDQFGGKQGKKFKSKAFRELLLSIQDKNMEEQKELIHQIFETWRGDIEQIDDVCIIGVKI